MTLLIVTFPRYCAVRLLCGFDVGRAEQRDAQQNHIHHFVGVRKLTPTYATFDFFF